MKLLFCKNCYDIFNLSKKSFRKCECGQTCGKYVTDNDALYSGEHAVPLGISNTELRNAIMNQKEIGQSPDFKAFVISKKCSTFIKL